MTRRSVNIRGVGNDLVEIKRVREAIERQGQNFLDRLFTAREQAYCVRFRDPVPHFSGHFSAKEAVVKAFGTGFGSKIGWRDIEILHDEQGRPVVALSDSVRALFGDSEVFISISHTLEYATAIAIWGEGAVRNV